MTNGDTVNGDHAKEPAQATTNSVLLTTQTGSVALITPLDEQAYRRLGALQNHLNSLLDHACGLNPRAYRAVDSETVGGRGVLDGTILQRWNMLSAPRKAEACARVGSSLWEIRTDLAHLAGGALDYF